MALQRSAVRPRLAPQIFYIRSPSSRGLGHRTFDPITGVRLPLGTHTVFPFPPPSFPLCWVRGNWLLPITLFLSWVCISRRPFSIPYGFFQLQKPPHQQTNTQNNRTNSIPSNSFCCLFFFHPPHTPILQNYCPKIKLSNKILVQ